MSYIVVDLMKAGIIDSTKAMRVAIEHSVAVASLLLNTKCIIPYQ
jgi:chaperonin GroEL (HSP60 family)